MKKNIGIYLGSIAVIICLGLFMAGCASGPSGTATGHIYNCAVSNGDDVRLTINDNLTWVASVTGTTTETNSGTYEINADGSYNCFVSGTSFKLAEIRDTMVFALIPTGSGSQVLAGAARGAFAESTLGGTYNLIDYDQRFWGTIEVNTSTHKYNYMFYALVSPEMKTVVSSENGVDYTYLGNGIAQDVKGTRFLICPNGVMVIDIGDDPMALALKQPASADISQFNASYLSLEISEETEGLITIESSANPMLQWNFPPVASTGTLEVIFNGIYHYTDNIFTAEAVFMFSPKKILSGLMDVSFPPGGSPMFIGGVPTIEVL